MHSVLWEKWGKILPIGMIIDHHDRNGFNNQRENLRLATRSQNSTNSKTKSNNISNFKGVHFDNRRGNYQSMIRVKGKLQHIGMFSKPEDAAYAFNICSKKIHKEFAYFNDVKESQIAIETVNNNKKLQAILFTL